MFKFFIIIPFCLSILACHTAASNTLTVSDVNYAKTFYRGMDERQVAINKVLTVLLEPSSVTYIPSWRWSNLSSLLPSASADEIKQKIDTDIASMRSSNTLGEIGSCHMSVYDCSIPANETLLGKSFKDLQLPSHCQNDQ